MVKDAKKKSLAVVKKKEAESASHRRKRLLARRFDKLKVTDANKQGILYIGHLPKGMNEDQLRKFFEQFGSIKKLRVARSPKTARPKGFAFLQFEEGEKVAQIAAKAMNNYIIFGRTLQVQLVQDAHPDMFKHANKDWKFVPKQLMHRNKVNREEKTPADRKARVEGLLQKEKERRDRLKELEIDYKFPGFSALVQKPKKSAAVPEAKQTDSSGAQQKKNKDQTTKPQEAQQPKKESA